MVARCTSSPWIELDSIDRFRRSQFSTLRNSLIRRSRSSRFMGTVMGRAWVRPPGPASPAHAWRIISMLANRGLPDRSEFWPIPGSTNGLVCESLIRSPAMAGARRPVIDIWRAGMRPALSLPDITLDSSPCQNAG
ncbi:hypothetical protein DK45_3932 [Bordetella bronchiseptica]|nr:hypothetical protein DK45_3932 [Bordetella bronchiseptica]